LKFFNLFIFIIFSYISALGQENFVIEDGKTNFKLSFELVSDLVVIPLEINGLELSFLLDTGVDATILFSLGDHQSLDLKNTEGIFIRGLGEGEPVKALRSSGNEMRIGKAVHKNLDLYLVFDNPISLSNRMGVPVHGIIGNDFFKNFIVEFNYIKKQLRAFEPESYEYKKCRRCDEIQLTLFKNKPYINVIGRIDNRQIPLNLLIDSGSGDAIWLFSDKKKGINIPSKNFPDYLGFGIGGSIYGVRSRIKELKIGKFNFPEITVSFPDTSFFKGMETFESRNGSLGAQVLKRFNVTIDYPGRKMRLKPNRQFDDPFNYDMSGVVIAHDGFKFIRDVMRSPLAFREDDVNNTGANLMIYKSSREVKYSLEPEYKIVEIRPDSPAERSGLMKGDILLKINGKPSYKYTLSQIASLLSSTQGKKVKFQVERGGFKKTFSFVLKRIL